MYSKEIADYLHDRGLMPDSFYYANYGDPQKNLFIIHEKSIEQLARSKEQQERLEQQVKEELEKQLPKVLEDTLDSLMKGFT